MSAVGNKSFIQDGFIVLTADLKNCLYFALKSPVVGFLSAKYKKKNLVASRITVMSRQSAILDHLYSSVCKSVLMRLLTDSDCDCNSQILICWKLTGIAISLQEICKSFIGEHCQVP